MNKEKDYEAQYTAYFISRMIELIKENYYIDISYKNLYKAAIKGLLSGLDEHTVYLFPEKVHETVMKEYITPVEEYTDPLQLTPVSLCRLLFYGHDDYQRKGW